MPLTDPQGNPIPEGDDRLPRKAATDAERVKADAMKARLEAMGATLGPLVEIEATVDALVGLLVNPDPTSAVRRLYEHRLQVARVKVLGGIFQAIHEAEEAVKMAAAPRIEVASTADVLAAKSPTNVYRG